jgi:hypothetical protein
MADVIGPSTLAISQTVNAFGTFLPKLSEVRKANVADDPDVAGDVRLGEIAAVTLAIGVGAISSSITGSSQPAVVAVVVALVLVGVYEYALRNDKPCNPSKSQPRTLKVVGGAE